MAHGSVSAGLGQARVWSFHRDAGQIWVAWGNLTAIKCRAIIFLPRGGVN